jgi:N-acetylmuramoyl-L-alanine amidase
MTLRTRALMIVGAVLLTTGIAYAQPPRTMYTQALARDRAVRDARQASTLKQIRAAVAAYERVVRKYPASGYSDNALWQAGQLCQLAWERFGDDSDRRTGVRLLKQLQAGYPSSSLASGIDEALGAFESKAAAATPPPAPIASALSPPSRAPATMTAPPDVVNVKKASAPAPEPARTPSPSGVVTVRGISRTALPDGVRVSIEMDQELLYHQEQIENPKRLFFDLRGAHLPPNLGDKTLSYADDSGIIREIRLGRRPQNTARVVMDLNGVESYSVFTLYNPYRLIVDFRRQGAPAAPIAALPLAPVAPPMPAPVPTTGSVKLDTKPLQPLKTSAPVITPPVVPPSPRVVTAAPLPSRDVAPPALSAPAVPAANSNGEFSLARQLGLGVSRIVIDPGHGGHDPGASGNGVNEAELVLDVSLRLKKLLEKEPGIEVVMTRDTDVFIPLDQRTAIANREGADLFLSVHANASRNPKARGVETYFLNFAANPEAEAVAARENSSSGQTMHRLPDIVRAIALNNKLDESRDFAEMVQKSMVKKLTARNRDLRDLGVKQAPFVVLIGAGMPSVLAEISFVTHKQEGQLLKTPAYRQQIADALFEAISKYQKSLKSRNTIASRQE